MPVTRPLVRYHGGKFLLAPWIISHLPNHHVYVEPFGGGGGVLLRKPRSNAEIYNDLDGEIVNVFRMARDHGDALIRTVELTPFANKEFMMGYEPSDDPLEQARRTIVRSFMGFGSAAMCGETSTFRANIYRDGTTPALSWRNYPVALRCLIDRLRGVVIENKDAVSVMQQHDGPDTVHYVDPPYVHCTRSLKAGSTDNRKSYKHEMTNDQHRDLAAVLRRLQGAVVLSGYPCRLYDELYGEWTRIDKAAYADGARDRIECLWLSPNTRTHQMMMNI